MLQGCPPRPPRPPRQPGQGGPPLVAGVSAPATSGVHPVQADHPDRLLARVGSGGRNRVATAGASVTACPSCPP